MSYARFLQKFAQQPRVAVRVATRSVNKNLLATGLVGAAALTLFNTDTSGCDCGGGSGLNCN